MASVVEIIAGDGISLRTEEREGGKIVVTVTVDGTTGTIDTSADLDGESASDLTVPSQKAVYTFVTEIQATLESAISDLDSRVTVLEGA